MIDVGFNLMMRAMMRRKSTSGLDRLIKEEIDADDPYSALKVENASKLTKYKKSLQKLASALGVRVEKTLWEQRKTLDHLYLLLSDRKKTDLTLDGAVQVDADNQANVDIAMHVRAGKASRMTVVCRLDGFCTDNCTVRKMTVHFWAAGSTVEFAIDPMLLDAARLLGSVKKHADYKTLAKGSELFLGGMDSLAKHLRAIWVDGTAPWSCEYLDGEDDSEGGPGTYLGRVMYRAEFGRESYAIEYSGGFGGIYKIESVWVGKFKFESSWQEHSDFLFKLILLNAYMVYDMVSQVQKEPESSPPTYAVRPKASKSDRQSTSSEKPKKQEAPKPPKRPFERLVEKVHVNDLVVRSSIRTCCNPKHEAREVTAVVCVFSPKRGVVEESVEAFCCPQCQRYYVLEKNFDRLQRKGRLCCRVVTRQGTVTELAPKLADDLSDQSFYNSMGYNVNQEENLTPGERRAILDFIIVNDFRTQKQAIGYLQWLIRRNGRNRNMGIAVRRWQSDIDYLMKRKKSDVQRVKIDRIFLTKHKW